MLRKEKKCEQRIGGLYYNYFWDFFHIHIRVAAVDAAIAQQ